MYRSQSIAATLLGTPLAFLLAGFWMQFGPGAPATNYYVANLLLIPIWCAIMIWGLKRERGSTVWIWLAVALAVAIAAMLIARKLLGS